MFKYHLLRTCCLSPFTIPQFSFKKKGNMVIHTSVCVWAPYSGPWVSIPVLGTQHYCVHYCSFLTVLISSIADNSPFVLQERIHCTWSLKFVNFQSHTKQTFIWILMGIKHVLFFNWFLPNILELLDCLLNFFLTSPCPYRASQHINYTWN